MKADDTRFPALDGLRAVGALAVVLTHVGFQSGAALHGPFAALLARLDWGVALFFGISGFLLFRPYVVAKIDGASTPPVRRYLWHRALRIVPVLWLAIGTSALLLAHPGRGPMAFVEHAVLIQVYLPNNSLEGLTQMWSLATEAAFYVALPFIGWLLTRVLTGRRWCWMVLSVCALLVVASPTWMALCASRRSALGHLWLPGFMGWFAVGMALATWQVARSRGLLPATVVDTLALSPGTLWACAGALFVLVGTPIGGPMDLTSPEPAEAFVKSLLYALIAALVILPAIAPTTTPPVSVRALAGRVSRYSGSISYGVFGYHVVILALAASVLDLPAFTGGFGLRLLWTLAVSIGVASMSFYWVERPLMRLGRRREAQAGYIIDGSPAPDATETMPVRRLPAPLA